MVSLFLLFPLVSFLSSLHRPSVVFVPALCLLLQSIGSSKEKTDEKSLPVFSKRAWFDSRSSSWPSQKRKGWKKKPRSIYGNAGLYSKCTQVQSFTGNFQASSQVVQIKSTVSQSVWPLCLRPKMMISFEQCWFQQVHRAAEVKCSPCESQSLMSLKLQQRCI